MLARSIALDLPQFRAAPLAGEGADGLERGGAAAGALRWALDGAVAGAEAGAGLAVVAGLALVAGADPAFAAVGLEVT
jgi:hypothetical protein